MAFPATRLRRLRVNPLIRSSLQETDLSARRLVAPLFVRPGRHQRVAIAPMPGQYQLSIDELLREAQSLRRRGIVSLLLFGIPAKKDAVGSQAYAASGIAQQAIRALKNHLPDMLIAADLCFCEYTSHGHCGILKRSSDKAIRRSSKLDRLIARSHDRWEVDNDATLKITARTAIAQARAGADIIAPS